MTDMTASDAEAITRDIASTLTDPRAHECLACYLERMVDEFGCDSRLRFAGRFRDLVAPRATALERRLWQVGGYCDCEVLMNSVQPHPRLWRREQRTALDGWDDPVDMVPPTLMPPCMGARHGSTKPCGNWQVRRGFLR